MFVCRGDTHGTEVIALVSGLILVASLVGEHTTVDKLLHGNDDRYGAKSAIILL